MHLQRFKHGPARSTISAEAAFSQTTLLCLSSVSKHAAVTIRLPRTLSAPRTAQGSSTNNHAKVLAPPRPVRTPACIVYTSNPATAARSNPSHPRKHAPWRGRHSASTRASPHAFVLRPPVMQTHEQRVPKVHALPRSSAALSTTAAVPHARRRAMPRDAPRRPVTQTPESHLIGAPPQSLCSRSVARVRPAPTPAARRPLRIVGCQMLTRTRFVASRGLHSTQRGAHIQAHVPASQRTRSP